MVKVRGSVVNRTGFLDLSVRPVSDLSLTVDLSQLPRFMLLVCCFLCGRISVWAVEHAFMFWTWLLMLRVETGSVCFLLPALHPVC